MTSSNDSTASGGEAENFQHLLTLITSMDSQVSVQAVTNACLLLGACLRTINGKDRGRIAPQIRKKAQQLRVDGKPTLESFVLEMVLTSWEDFSYNNSESADGLIAALSKIDGQKH